MKKEFFFKKEERLTGKKNISELFEKGIHINNKLIRTTFIFSEEEMNYPAKVLFSVPKKSINKSYLRNRIKRKMREVYRQEKHQLYEILNTDNKKIHIAYVFKLKEDVQYNSIRTAILDSFKKIKKLLFTS